MSLAELRAALADARAAAALADAGVAAARDRLARLRAQRTALDRVAGADAPERAALDAEVAEVQAALEAAQANAARASKRAGGAHAALADAADPREAIGELDDGLPVLLLPVRLETCFADGQLWVRIFPDECSIDTFEPALSDDEVAAARRYWAGIWAAGGVEAQERTAWRGLVAGAGSGRARYIADRVVPAEPDGRPVKALPTDVVLVLLLDAPLPAGERDAIAAFWRDAWRAGGDAEALGAAREALVDELGAARAAEVEEDVVPVNLGEAPASGVDRADVAVTVATLVLTGDVAGRTTSWSRAPTAELLPDRFVFLGYPDDAEPVVVVGAPVASPLTAGPDPSDPPHQDDDGELVVPDALRWTVDFDRAVADGMGLKVDLEGAAAGGFRRVLVVGLRLASDPEAARLELEALLRHHATSRNGLAVLAQGTPTNNTEEASSGLLRGDDADACFDGAERFTDAAEPLDRRDGQWLAEHLGIDPDVLRDVPGTEGADQADARAMNAALWPATLGFWADTLMAPVLGEGTVRLTREYLCRFVSGRGPVPAVRIGRQPYGILPVTAYSRMSWLDARSVGGLPGGWLRRVHALLTQVAADWRAMAAGVPSAAQPGDDPHATLLDVLGLHPGSVEYAQRWTERFVHLRRRLGLEGLDAIAGTLDPARAADATRELLARLGWAGETPELAELLFFGRHNRLTGPVVDEAPLSETARLPVATADGRTYLGWLVDAASTSLDALYRQEGFTGDGPPRALLYLLARHALQLGYHDSAVRLHAAVGLEAVRGDAAFLHLDGQGPSASRYAPLYARIPEITGSDALDVGGFIGETVGTLPEADGLRAQLRALEHLDGATTARLERAFAEHVDLCSYRLDAWLLGLVHLQLHAMRSQGDGGPRRGLHLGAYAWLEDLRPDPEPGTSQGHVHAPSLNQAVAAAVLRSGHAVHEGAALSVGLTSARVRVALGLLEGVRQGQSLGALLGYRLERGLHDAHAVAEVDRFILDLRRAFPLAGDRLASTSTAAAGDPAPIESIEARNVVDGLRLVEQVAASGSASYPFGRSDLPNASPAERAAIDAEVALLLDHHDAVADLALAEGVHQAVLGNHDRVASTYEAYAKGAFPPEPQVVATPGGATGLTHRVALHLDPAATVPPSATPRARCAPALDTWLAGMLPDLGDVACTVAFVDAGSGDPVEEQVTLADLALRPLDLLRILHDEGDQGTGELDDRVLLAVDADHAPRPDTPVEIRYLDAGTRPISVFEVLPLARSLRTLLAGARPLRPTDLRLTAEASAAQDASAAADRDLVAALRDDVEALREDADVLRSDLEDAAILAPAALSAGLDVAVDAVCALLARVAAYALPQAGWTFAHDARREAFAGLLATAADVAARWTPRVAQAQALVDEEAAGGHTAEERIDLLLRAEALVSTDPVSPLPPLGALRAQVAAKVQAMAARRDGFAAIAATTRTRVGDLLGDVQALLPVAGIDPQEPELDHVPARRFAEDAARITAAVVAELDTRLDASAALLAAHDASAAPAVRLDALTRAAKALLGEDAILLGRFTLPADHAAELANAHAAAQDGTLLADLAAKGVDEPVDTWLYGMARVREPLRAWEAIVMLAGALGRDEPELLPHQLPYVPDDRWLALDLPPEPNLSSARLLYTAHFAAPFDPAAASCGLLLDELSETIPADTLATGLAFHHDRPGAEAPQSMLLVTPTAFRGAWRWEDLVDALHETLDLARIRAVEPVHVDASPYAPLLPATVMAVTTRQLSISANLAFNSDVAAFAKET